MLWLTLLTSIVLCTSHASSPTDSLPSEAFIAIEELEFRDVRIQPAFLDAYEFAGRIKNTSRKYTLRSVAVRIAFYDCVRKSDDSTCIRIGERREAIYTAIPPGEERAFKEPIYIYGDVLKVKGDLVWRYDVLATTSGR